MLIESKSKKTKTKPKKTKKKIKTKPKKKKIKKELISKKDSTLQVPELAATDQATRFISAIENVYSLAISSSLAAAIVELKIVKEALGEDDEEGSEIDDRFNRDMFTEVQTKLLELKTVSELGVAFGIDGKYLDQIMAVKIEALFGKKISKNQKNKAYVGSQEDFLSYMAKQKILSEQPK